ncbi:glycosyltransferase [Spirulina sp. CS-785/01]|uniref:glycosyltransferase family 2 protein n=1 Tax=Spirulina sp. CS-785/01 TaxID=3021716 RepID=UPI00232B5B05|nr:glycosyltransferase [Spirulina sp. CS-785/01]MDB9313963.1 glycosyltransferase [Spirulina sp. CS-785/01]
MKNAVLPIEPLSEESHRPFWSVMIPAYNRVDYLKRTLESVLAQNIPPEQMQIEVIDNASTLSDIAALVREIAGERVSCYRQPYNVGMAENWTTCVQRAKGYWVHILHDDDIVLPGFYKAYQQVIEQTETGMVVGQAVIVDEQENWLNISPYLENGEGVVKNAQQVLSGMSLLTCPAVVVARKSYETLGGFNRNLIHAMDWEMWVRVATYGQVGWVNKPYCLYRVHSQSGTKLATLKADTIKDVLKGIKIIENYFPTTDKREEFYKSIYYYLGRACEGYSCQFALEKKYKYAIIHELFMLRLLPYKWHALGSFLLWLKMMLGSWVKG